MLDPGLQQAIEALRRGDFRCQTVILLLAPEQLPMAPEMAARHGIGYVDFVERALRSLPANTRFVQFTGSSLFGILDTVAQETDGARCVLLYNLDLGLARLTAEERHSLWGRLFRDIPYRPRALIIAMPAGAEHLLPRREDLEEWGRCGRVVSLVASEDD